MLLRKDPSGVAWITLNRPQVLNACDIATLKKLQGVLKDVENDPAVRCIVITGSGRAFCSGADLQSLKDRGGYDKQRPLSLTDDLKDGFNPVILKIRTMEKPVIGMVNGVAAGAGMSIAFACDLRVMSEDAKFVEAFAKVGLIPDAGSTFFMPRLLGLAKAMELAFTGEGIDSGEALMLGIVNRVVPQVELARVTGELASKLAAGPRGIGLAKRAINRAIALDLEQALEYEAHVQGIAGRTEDHQEGVRAFSEKRPSKFRGK